MIISAPAKAAVLMNELFPGATTALLSLANRMLPGPAEEPSAASHAGFESQSQLAPSWLTRPSERAAVRNNEVGEAG